MIKFLIAAVVSMICSAPLFVYGETQQGIPICVQEAIKNGGNPAEGCGSYAGQGKQSQMPHIPPINAQKQQMIANPPSIAPVKAPVSPPPLTQAGGQGQAPPISPNSGGIVEPDTNYDALMPPIGTALPEVPTPFEMSRSDINRLICPAGTEAKDASETDIAYSQEKGVVIKIVGRNVFVKFQVRKTGMGQVKYSSTPSELFVICGDTIYNIIAIPTKMPSKTVRLVEGSDKAKKNIAIYGPMPFEKKIITLINDIYEDNIPDSFTVTPVNKRISLFAGIDIDFFRQLTIDGEGLVVKEFRVKNEGMTPVELNEKDFLKSQFGTSIAAVSIKPPKLQPGDVARLFIVENKRGDDLDR